MSFRSRRTWLVIGGVLAVLAVSSIILFSWFKFAPQPTIVLSPTVAATATPFPLPSPTPTVTPLPVLSAPAHVTVVRSYYTQAPMCIPILPGFATWVVSYDPSNKNPYTCVGDHVHLRTIHKLNDSTDLDLEQFKVNVLSHNFRTTISIRNISADACLRDEVALIGDHGDYTVKLCTDGSVTGYLQEDGIQNLVVGTVPAKHSYQLTTTVFRGAVYIYVDGKYIGGFKMQSSAVKRVYYYFDSLSSTGASADFSRFRLDQLAS